MLIIGNILLVIYVVSIFVSILVICLLLSYVEKENPEIWNKLVSKSYEELNCNAKIESSEYTVTDVIFMTFICITPIVNTMLLIYLVSIFKRRT